MHPFCPSMRRPVRSASSGSPLLEGLIDWWELGDFTGKHAGNVLGYATDHYLTTDPFGGSAAWYAGGISHGDPTNQTFRPNPTYTIDRDSEWTIASLLHSPNAQTVLDVGRDESDGGPFFNPSPRGSNWRNWNDDGIARTEGQTLRSSGDVTSLWFTFVASFDGVTLRIWVDDFQTVEVVPPAPAMGYRRSSPAYFFRGGPDRRLAVGCHSTRAWTAEDAATFYNSGNFLRYADL